MSKGPLLNTSQIAKNVRIIMVKMKLDQEHIGNQLGLIRRDVIPKLNGTIAFTGTELDILAHYLNTTVDALCYDKPLDPVEEAAPVQIAAPADNVLYTCQKANLKMVLSYEGDWPGITAETLCLQLDCMIVEIQEMKRRLKGK